MMSSVNSILRDYQLGALSRLGPAQTAVMAREGRGSGIVLCAPTGAGKTVCAAAWAERALADSERFVFVTDRNILAWQTVARLVEYGLPEPALLQGSNTRGNPDSAPMVVASAQTISARMSRQPLGPLDSIRHLWIDEVHVCRRSTLKLAKAVEEMGGHIVGLSATPLSGHLHSWDGIVNMSTTRALQADGWLVPERVETVYTPDMTGARTVGGEWTDDSAAEAVGERAVDIIAREWRERCRPDAKTLVFAATVDHARMLQAAFTSARPGLSSAVVSYEDGEVDTAAALEAFGEGWVTALFSVSKLAVGFDQPAAEVAVLARPLSRGVMLHIQQIGRVLRPSPGKQDALILDASGNWERFSRETSMLWERGMPELPPEFWPKQGKSAWMCRAEPAEGRKPKPCLRCDACIGVKKPSVKACHEPCCGTRNPYTKEACEACGEPKPPSTVETKVCSACSHTQHNPGAVVCEACGDPLPSSEQDRCRTCGWLMQQLDPLDPESPLVCTGPSCRREKQSQASRVADRERIEAARQAREREEREREERLREQMEEREHRASELLDVSEPLRTCVILANRLHRDTDDRARAVRRLRATYRDLTGDWPGERPRDAEEWINEHAGWSDATPDRAWERQIDESLAALRGAAVGKGGKVSLRPSGFTR